jgi:hypothetical protein
LPSPEQREVAALLLRKAESDVDVVRALVENPSIADDAIGFDLDRDASLRSAEQALVWARGVLDRSE